MDRHLQEVQGASPLYKIGGQKVSKLHNLVGGLVGKLKSDGN